MKKLLLVAGGIAAIALVAKSQDEKGKSAVRMSEPDEPDTSLSAAAKQQMREILTWLSTSGLSDGAKDALTAALPKMAEDEISDTYQWVKSISKGGTFIEPDLQQRLQVLQAKYGILTTYVFRGKSADDGQLPNKTDIPAESRPIETTKKSTTMAPPAPGGSKKKVKIHPLLMKTEGALMRVRLKAFMRKRGRKNKASTDAIKNFEKAVDIMSTEELKDMYVYVFKFMAKGVEPADQAYMDRMKALFKKYNIH